MTELLGYAIFDSSEKGVFAMKNKVALSQDGTVAYVTLTQGQTTIVDAADVPNVMQHRWYAMRKKGSDRYYAVTNARDSSGKMRVLPLGRFLTLADSYDRVTCINGNPLDNRKENLQRKEKGTGFLIEEF